MSRPAARVTCLAATLVLAALLPACASRSATSWPPPRLADGPPPPAPAAWQGLLGAYAAPGEEPGEAEPPRGVSPNVLYVLEHDGALQALPGRELRERLRLPTSPVRLRPLAGDTFDLDAPPAAAVVFSRGEEGRGEAVRFGATELRRVALGPGAGGTFRIEPIRPVEELRREAMAAEPPAEEGSFHEPELVEPSSLDPTILLDIRYAGIDNFMGARFYDEARAFLQRPAAEALARVSRRLRPLGYGLLIHDAYRPWHVTKMFWDATPAHQKQFVADPARGSRHNRGAAVDLTLYDLETGRPVPMPSGYDEFTERAYPDWPGGTSRQRWHRDLLRAAMQAEGFDVYPAEWWHFDHRDWKRYPILDLPFERISGSESEHGGG